MTSWWTMRLPFECAVTTIHTLLDWFTETDLVHINGAFHFIVFYIYIYVLFLIFHCYFKGNSGCVTRVSHSSCKSSTTHFYQWVQYFWGVQTVVWLPVFETFNVRTDVDACECTRRLHGRHNTLRESAPEVDSGRKSLVTPGTQTHQYCPWLLSQMAYQLSYPTLFETACFIFQANTAFRSWWS